MYKLFVVYYINCIINNNYFDWLTHQINYVRNLGATIYIIATTTQSDEEYFRKRVEQLFPNEKVIIECNYNNEYEYQGILKVWELGQEHCTQKDIILYFHSKGVTHYSDYKYNKEDSYNIILKNYKKIEDIFTKYNTIDKIGYSCGGNGWIWYNFWYVRGSYIKYVEKPIKTTRRHYYEDWLGRKVKNKFELFCETERPISYYENTLMSCYSFYTDKIHWNIGSYYNPAANKHIQIYKSDMYIFDWMYYLNRYPDLRRNGVITKKQAIQHWENRGILEGRTAKMYIFDWEYYLNTYPDLRINGVCTQAQAISHWMINGLNEGRHPNKNQIDYIQYN
jgi:hypothetical protein